MHLKLSGHFDAVAVATAAVHLLSEAEKVQPGFTLISDLRDCRPTDSQTQQEMAHVMTHLCAIGLARVVRIARFPLTTLQMERLCEQVGYEAFTVFSQEEADRVMVAEAVMNADGRFRSWEKQRKYRRVAVGRDHTVTFRALGREFPSTPIANLSAQGCFAILPRAVGQSIHDGMLLSDFSLDHPDLPSTPISAKVVRTVPQVSEAEEEEMGLGIMFLCEAPSFIEWVDAYVSAYHPVAG